MANIVSIQNRKYLVDVGIGSNPPQHPIPLDSGTEFDIIPPVRGKLEFRNINGQTDPDLRAWVYSTQEDQHARWTERFMFTLAECLPGDFDMINGHVSTDPDSFFVRSVVAVRGILDPERTKTVGELVLHDHKLWRRIGPTTEILEILKTEARRVAVLELYFDIVLSPDERAAINGRSTALNPPVDAPPLAPSPLKTP
jgi:arylamine N-acetyltransferase